MQITYWFSFNLTMLRTTIILYLVIFSAVCDSDKPPNKNLKIKARLTSVKCVVPPSEYNITSTCGIKSFRNGTQLLTYIMNFHKPCYDFWAHLMILYKFGGSAQYRPWLFNNDEDVCAAATGRATLSLWYTLLRVAIDRFSPSTLHKCPYYGVEGLNRKNLGDIIAHAVPHVLPTGDYRVFMRFHTSTNVTFFHVTIGVHVDAVNPLEAISMVSMGRK